MFLRSASQHHIITVSQFHCVVLSHIFLIVLSQNHKISLYRDITKSLCHKIAKSLYRKIAVFFYTILRDAICDITYQRFFKVFQCEFYINACDAMEFVSQSRNLSFLLIRKCLIILCAM